MLIKIFIWVKLYSLLTFTLCCYGLHLNIIRPHTWLSILKTHRFSLCLLLHPIHLRSTTHLKRHFRSSWKCTDKILYSIINLLRCLLIAFKIASADYNLSLLFSSSHPICIYINHHRLNHFSIRCILNLYNFFNFLFRFFRRGCRIIILIYNITSAFKS